MHSITPTKIRVVDSKLQVQWSNGKSYRYTMRMLRKSCPCAACAAERNSKGASFIPLFTKVALTLENVEQSGYYALRLIWKDGHNTGIFDFAYLYALGSDDSLVK